MTLSCDLLLGFYNYYRVNLSLRPQECKCHNTGLPTLLCSFILVLVPQELKLVTALSGI